MPWFADLLLMAATAAVTGTRVPDIPMVPFTTCPVPGDVVDAEMDIEGSLYFLRSGTPHLEVRSADGDVTFFDLPEVQLPGGLCLEDRWGWWVSDVISGVTYRYDATGTAVDSVPTPGRPGDICTSGLSILYVSMDRGTVMDLGRSGEDLPLLRISGAGQGQLSTSPAGAVYSDGTESYMLPLLGEPSALPGTGTWNLCGGDAVLLRGDSLLTGSWRIEVRGASAMTRMSSSPDGGCIILWVPGGEEALVRR